MLQYLKQEAAKNFFSKIIHDTIGYYKIYDYLKYKIPTYISNDIINLDTIRDFWYSILGDQFKAKADGKYFAFSLGQKIKMKNVFLSDWIPKLPGKLWTIDGIQKLKESKNYALIEHINFGDSIVYDVLDPHGKYLRISAGFGSVRLNASIFNDPNQFYCLSLTDSEYWNVDYGIPVIINKSIYEEFLKYSKDGAPEVDLGGIVYINNPLPIKEIIYSAIGSEVDPKLISNLVNSQGLPKCFIYIPSLLMCKFKYNNSHPECTAWTSFNSKLEYKSGLWNINYTYSHFNPKKIGSIEKSIEFIENYVKEYGNGVILTDFDGKIPRLKAKNDLINDPAGKTKMIKDLYSNIKKTEIENISYFDLLEHTCRVLEQKRSRL